MREPRHYHRAMLLNQTFVTVIYCVIGSVVYWYCGQYVSQPSLGSAGTVMKRVSFGLAIPGLFFSVILWVHVSNVPKRQRVLVYIPRSHSHALRAYSR